MSTVFSSFRVFFKYSNFKQIFLFKSHQKPVAFFASFETSCSFTVFQPCRDKYNSLSITFLGKEKQFEIIELYCKMLMKS